MQFRNFLITIFIFSLFSCKEESYNDIAEFIQQNVGANQLTIQHKDDSVIMHIHYETPPQVGFDFKSSSAAMQFVDTAKESIKKNALKIIQVNIHSNQQVMEYNYPITDIEANQVGLDITAKFLQNFLSSRNEQNARYVDLDKISLEDLLNLNIVNEQIQSNVEITHITFDGFTSHHASPQNIEFRGNLQGENETFPFVAEYDRTKKKIFYFGINE